MTETGTESGSEPMNPAATAVPAVNPGQ
jgi:hypothetical protein